MTDLTATPTSPVTVTIAGLKWQIEPIGQGLRLTAPRGHRINWRTGIRIMDRDWTTIELELEERPKSE